RLLRRRQAQSAGHRRAAAGAGHCTFWTWWDVECRRSHPVYSEHWSPTVPGWGDRWRSGRRDETGEAAKRTVSLLSTRRTPVPFRCDWTSGDARYLLGIAGLARNPAANGIRYRRCLSGAGWLVWIQGGTLRAQRLDI